MRIVLQRVTQASVSIDGRTVGHIGRGFCILIGVTHADTLAEAEWLADKVAGLRIFSDAEDRMNLSLDEVGGAVLVISQFTLYGDTAKGRRPSFIDAARPDQAVPLYEVFLAALLLARPHRGHGRIRCADAGGHPERRTSDPHL